MMGPSESQTDQVSLSEKAADLFRYLLALQKMQNVSLRNSAKYRSRGGLIQYLSELPHSDGVTVTRADESTDVGAEIAVIQRLAPTQAPAAPEELAAHVRGDLSDPLKVPTLIAPASFEEGVEEHSTSEDIQDSFDIWMEYWQEWANTERERARVRDLYADLFALREQLSAAPHDWELLLGIGRLRIRTRGDLVDRHVIVMPLRMELDGSTGAISLLTAEGAAPTVEFDMLTAEELPVPAACGQLEAAVSDLPEFHPLERAQWEAPLQAFINSAMPDGEYSDVPDQESARPRLSFSPAIIVRPRNRSGLIRALDAIATDLSSRTDIPAGIKALVDPDSVDDSPASDVPHSGGAAYERDGEYYLPLPVNAEQLQVLGRADSRPLTVVQGPPGTGKTHTTAVLISHFLTQGKRVLVTAQSQQALREVRDKLPEEIKELAVSVIGNDRQEMANLRASINAISQKSQMFSAVENSAAIEAATQEIDDLSRRRAQLRNELIEAGALEAAPRDTPFGRRRLAEVAQRLLDEEHDLPWASDIFPEAQIDAEAPSQADVTEYLELSRQWAACELRDEVEALPSTVRELPDPETVVQLLYRWSELSAVKAAEADVLVDPELVDQLTRPEDVEELRATIVSLLAVRGRLLRRPEPWVSAAVRDIQVGKTRQWMGRRDGVRDRLDRAKDLLPKASAQGVVSVAPTTIELRPLVASLLDHVRVNPIKVDAAGQPKTGMMAPRQVKAGKPLFEAVRIGGRPPTSHEDFQALDAHFQLLEELNGLDESWPEGTSVSGEDSAAERLAWHSDEVDVLDDVLALIEYEQDVRNVAQRYGLNHLDVSEDSRLSSTVQKLDVLDTRLQLGQVDVELQQLSSRIVQSSGSASCLADVARALQDRDPDKFIATREHAQAVLDQRAANERRTLLANELSQRHPQLVREIDADPLNSKWPAQIHEMNKGWMLSAARNWIEARQSFDPNLAQAEIADIDARIRAAVSETVGRRSWAEAVGRLTPGRKADLQHYAQLVKSYGRGQGRRARYLQSAIRTALANCRDAVPVWIMPLHQVASSQTIAMNAFDVVIVDEASQAGLESLFLQYLAPKLIVVGDDKQVSPSAVGVQVEEVQALADRFLADNRYKAAFADPGRSLFDEAKMRYPDIITLREHRRCVPAIIGFSNEVAYAPEGVPLVPVREPGASALQPVITRFCEDGYLEGTSSNARNLVEVEAIVETIERMLDDPLYEGKTIGVISLLGPHQARLIERKLIAALPPEEIVQREIRCGDSASFQGAERDVILLSLVAAPVEGRRVVALTRDTFVQRYNVAASRAKDQMILFYSMPLDLLHNGEDMRYRLVEYCTRVEARSAQGIPGTVNALMPHDRLVAPFDSLFEQRVCNELVARGYVVIPQYESLGYRIDLVVVGANGKVAVECDGDHWHGPDRFGADLARQRDLERCGWTFHRILESDFILDANKSLIPLFDMLEERGILPGARAPQPRVVPDGTLERQTDESHPEPVVESADEEIAEAADPVPAEKQPTLIVEEASALQSSEGASEAQAALPLQAYEEARLAPLSQDWVSDRDLKEALLEVVAVEGPVIGHRLIRVVHRARGHKRLKKPSDVPYLRALQELVSDGRLLTSPEDPESASYWLPGAPEVRLRELGPRGLEDVPPLEIAQMISRCKESHPYPEGDDGYIRAVLRTYGLVRMTDKVFRNLMAIDGKYGEGLS